MYVSVRGKTRYMNVDKCENSLYTNCSFRTKIHLLTLGNTKFT